MTNKEHLSTLNAGQWVARVDWLYHNYGKSYNNTWYAIEDWLDKEYKPVTPIRTNEPWSEFYMCPNCYHMPITESDKACPKCYTDFDWRKQYE